MPGFPYLQKCFGFLFSWFRSLLLLDFEVSWFQIFKVVCWILGFKVSNFTGSMIHITKFLFHVLWKILIPYSRCSTNFKTDLHVFSVPVFSATFNCFDFQHSAMSKHNISQTRFDFSRGIMGSRQIKRIGVGAQ